MKKNKYRIDWQYGKVYEYLESAKAYFFIFNFNTHEFDSDEDVIEYIKYRQSVIQSEFFCENI